MCGRFSLIVREKSLSDYAGRQADIRYAGPSYNVAPSQSVPIITAKAVEPMRWGLVPQWAKSLTTGYSMINAKSESLMEKRTYSSLLQHSRCLVPATGFYEWLKPVDGPKVPYYFSLKERELFCFAGLFTQRTDAEGQVMKSFTIITTQANAIVQPVHDRMPVILERDEEEAWLDGSQVDVAALMPMLDPYPGSEMVAYAVSPLVGSTRNNSPDLIIPLNTDEQP